jgi:hypothetical protein
MVQYIDKTALVAKIRGYINNAEVYLKYHHNRNDKSVYAFEQEKLVMCELLSSLDTLEVKEIDLEKEAELIANGIMISVQANKYNTVVYNTKRNDFNHSHLMLAARKGIELGLSASNPITATDRGTAEEIIINLKRVEKDYRIDLTREIEWLRNKVKKGE